MLGLVDAYFMCFSSLAGIVYLKQVPHSFILVTALWSTIEYQSYFVNHVVVYMEIDRYTEMLKNLLYVPEYKVVLNIRQLHLSHWGI